MELDTLKVELKATEDAIRELLKTQSDEIRAQGETSRETSRKLAAAEQKYDAAMTALEEKARQLEAKLGRLDLGHLSGAEQRTPGQQLVESAEFKAFAAGSSRKARVEVKALVSAADSVGVLVRPQRLTEIIRPETRAHVRDLLPQGGTTSNAIEYPKEKVFTNNAAPVAEGGLKPESDLTFELATANVRTIAHWISASKQMLDDLPALQSYVDNRLTEGLLLAEDAQLLYGDGTGQNLLGLIPQATHYNRAQAGDTLIDTLRRAATQVRLSEYQADGIVLNPVDWEKIELAKDNEGRYLWVNVMNGGMAHLWRMPVVDTTAINEGEFLVGAMRMAAQLFVRQDATVEASEHDSDNFRRNLFTIRAEERLALAVFRPQAFVHGEFAAQ